MDFSMFEDLPGVSQMIQNMNPITIKPGNNNRPAPTAKPFPAQTPIAMAYVPFQQWNGTYSDEEGFKKGTIFPELDLPFSGEEARYDA